VTVTEEQLRARVLDAVAREPSPTRGQRRQRDGWLLALGSAAALAVFEAWGGVRPQGRPLSLIVATAVGSAGLAAVALVAALGRGRSMLGRSPGRLLATIALVPAALILWKVGVSGLFDGMSAAWPYRPGLRCLTLSLAVGVVPLLLALAARRGTDPVQPGMTGAAIGAACGLAAAALVDLWCPVAYLPHLLLGHLLPIALLAAAGVMAGSRLLAIRLRP
jgi:hypothetical protein